MKPDSKFLAAMACIAALAMPAEANCQSSRLSLDVVGGLHVPVGSASHAAGTGAALSLGLVHRLNSVISLTTEFQAAHLSGDRLAPGPIERGVKTDVSFLRWALGLEYPVATVGPHSRVAARAGIGFSTVGTDPIFNPGAFSSDFIRKINDDVFTLYAGLQVGRSFGTVTPFVRVQPEMYFTGSNLRELQPINQDIGESGVLIGVPIQMGLRIGF